MKTQSPLHFDGENLVVDDTYQEIKTEANPPGQDIDLIRLYGRDVADTKPVTNEEAVALLERIANGDTEARDTLILAYAKLPFYFLGRKKFKGLDPSELLSTVNMAVIDAVDKAVGSYDASKGSFAAWMLRKAEWALKSSIAKQETIVTVHEKARARAVKIKILVSKEGPQTEKEIAEKTGIPEYQVKSALLGKPKDISMSAPITNHNGVTVEDTIPDNRVKTGEQLYATTEGRAVLRSLFEKHLTPFQAQVMILSFGLDSTNPEFWTIREDAEVCKLLPGGQRRNIAKTRATAIAKLRNVDGLKDILQSLVASDRPYGKGEITPPHTDQFTTNDKRPVKGRKGLLSEDTVRAMRKLYDSGASVQHVADTFKMPYQTVYCVVTRKQYKYVKDTE